MEEGNWSREGRKGGGGVLQCTWDFVIKYGMMTDTKSTAFEKKFITYSSWKEEAHEATRALVEAPDQSGDKSKESMAQDLYCGFCRDEWVRKGRQIWASLELVWMIFVGAEVLGWSLVVWDWALGILGHMKGIFEHVVFYL